MLTGERIVNGYILVSPHFVTEFEEEMNRIFHLPHFQSAFITRANSTEGIVHFWFEFRFNLQAIIVLYNFILACEKIHIVFNFRIHILIKGGKPLLTNDA